MVVRISNRHVHLSQADLDTLFSAGYQLTKMKDLKRTGQFAAQETVTIRLEMHIDTDEANAAGVPAESTGQILIPVATV